MAVSLQAQRAELLLQLAFIHEQLTRIDQEEKVELEKCFYELLQEDLTNAIRMDDETDDEDMYPIYVEPPIQSSPRPVRRFPPTLPIRTVKATLLPPHLPSPIFSHTYDARVYSFVEDDDEDYGS